MCCATSFPLKILAAYPEAIQAHYHEDGAEAGALLLPTHVSPFEGQTDPSSDEVVLLSVTHPRMAVEHLLAYLGALTDADGRRTDDSALDLIAAMLSRAEGAERQAAALEAMLRPEQRNAH